MGCAQNDKAICETACRVGSSNRDHVRLRWPRHCVGPTGAGFLLAFSPMALSKSWAPFNGSFFSAFRASGSLGCLLGVGLLSLIGAVPAAKSRWLQKLFSALHLADKIVEIRDALRCYLVSRRRMAIAFSLTVTAHLFYFGTFYCTGRALEGNVMAASAVVRRDAFDHADCRHADRAAHQLCWNWSA